MVDSNDRERVQESAEELQKMVRGVGGHLLWWWDWPWGQRAVPKLGLPGRGARRSDCSNQEQLQRGKPAEKTVGFCMLGSMLCCRAAPSLLAVQGWEVTEPHGQGGSDLLEGSCLGSG